VINSSSDVINVKELPFSNSCTPECNILLIFINCINPPFVPFFRSRRLGQAVGRFSAGLGKRVLLLASGGMSHHPARYYPPPGEGEEAVAAWQLSGGDAPKSLSRKQWMERLERMHREGAEMIARGERTVAQMHLNAEADLRFLEVLKANRLEDYDSWDQDALVTEAGIGSMELHTWIAGAAAHKEAGGNGPQVGFYDVMLEIGIAAGVVYAD